MKCVNCENEMIDKSYSYYTSDDEDEDWSAVHHEEYICPNCNCKYIYKKWEIPNAVERPTLKQKNAILFINNKLSLHLEAITKQQCIRDISKYLAEAKRIEETKWDNDEYSDFDSQFVNFEWCC